MKRFTLFLLLIFSLLSCIAGYAQEGRRSQPVENEQTSVTLTVTGNNVRVQNAAPGSLLEVYNVLGLRVTSIKIDSIDKTITLNIPKGWYILKIENIARKVAIK
ncbi:T9SS type A sorting domain-containing protein [uncultured Bacteroides sp.]|uniref:T9SS type A sorting domain-containing protein n=1 Tax=uncultured Bacteroides sp. TaxID=162156 RepID=UPI002AAB4C1A|nr:T9SS type A sorting domain-containing protein [uncultured Bacteroides sp.]